MKRFFIFFVASSFFFTFIQSEQPPITENDQLLVVVLMVKDEEPVMQKTLQPFLDAKINNYFILDTGSTDKTIEICQELFKKNNVTHGYIASQPFVDFSTSRNYALRAAEKQFPNAIFFFMIDAEWYTHGVPELIQFCKDHAASPTLSYGLLIDGPVGAARFSMPRLFKAHKSLEFEGSVHEYLKDWTGQLMPEAIFVNYEPSTQGINKSMIRTKTDCKLLFNDYKKNPSNSRAIFMLAQTYNCRGETNKAIKWYKKRCDVLGYNDERFIAFYNLGKLYHRLKKWLQAIEYFTKAYSLQPTRAEPLICLAQLFWDTKNYPLCYLFALQALDIKCPDHNALLVETNLYNYVNYDLLGRVAWRIGDYDFGKQITLEALKLHPDDPQLTANLQHYKKEPAPPKKAPHFKKKLQKL